MSEHPKIKGAFSTKIVQEIGTGSTKRKVVQSFLYYAEETDDNEISMRTLNENNVPSGPEQIICKDEFLESFTPELELYTSTVYPAMIELNKTIAKADRQRKQGNTFTAEMEYGKALKIDEDNIRANFGLGLCYMSRCDDEKASDLFRRLVQLDAAFQPEHKHLFNDFGISLRKNGLFSEAIEFYKRATELSSADENLYFNIARCLFESNKKKEALVYAKKCLELNREFEQARKLYAHLCGRNFF